MYRRFFEYENTPRCDKYIKCVSIFFNTVFILIATSNNNIINVLTKDSKYLVKVLKNTINTTQ